MSNLSCSFLRNQSRLWKWVVLTLLLGSCITHAIVAPLIPGTPIHEAPIQKGPCLVALSKVSTLVTHHISKSNQESDYYVQLEKLTYSHPDSPIRRALLALAEFQALIQKPKSLYKESEASQWRLKVLTILDDLRANENQLRQGIAMLAVRLNKENSEMAQLGVKSGTTSGDPYIQSLQLRIISIGKIKLSLEESLIQNFRLYADLRYSYDLDHPYFHNSQLGLADRNPSLYPFQSILQGAQEDGPREAWDLPSENQFLSKRLIYSETVSLKQIQKIFTLSDAEKFRNYVIPSSDWTHYNAIQSVIVESRSLPSIVSSEINPSEPRDRQVQLALLNDIQFFLKSDRPVLLTLKDSKAPFLITRVAPYNRLVFGFPFFKKNSTFSTFQKEGTWYSVESLIPYDSSMVKYNPETPMGQSSYVEVLEQLRLQAEVHGFFGERTIRYIAEVQSLQKILDQGSQYFQTLLTQFKAVDAPSLLDRFKNSESQATLFHKSLNELPLALDQADYYVGIHHVAQEKAILLIREILETSQKYLMIKSTLHTKKNLAPEIFNILDSFIQQRLLALTFLSQAIKQHQNDLNTSSKKLENLLPRLEPILSKYRKSSAEGKFQDRWNFSLFGTLMNEAQVNKLGFLSMDPNYTIIKRFLTSSKDTFSARNSAHEFDFGRTMSLSKALNQWSDFHSLNLMGGGPLDLNFQRSNGEFVQLALQPVYKPFLSRYKINTKMTDFESSEEGVEPNQIRFWFESEITKAIQLELAQFMKTHDVLYDPTYDEILYSFDDSSRCFSTFSRDGRLGHRRFSEAGLFWQAYPPDVAARVENNKLKKIIGVGKTISNNQIFVYTDTQNSDPLHFNYYNYKYRSDSLEPLPMYQIIPHGVSVKGMPSLYGGSSYAFFSNFREKELLHEIQQLKKFSDPTIKSLGVQFDYPDLVWGRVYSQSPSGAVVFRDDLAPSSQSHQEYELTPERFENTQFIPADVEISESLIQFAKTKDLQIHAVAKLPHHIHPMAYLASVDFLNNGVRNLFMKRQTVLIVPEGVDSAP